MSARLIVFAIVISALSCQISSCSRSPVSEPPTLSRSSAVASQPGDDDEGELEDGEYDCSATNVSTGKGPYSITCEKNSDEIRIIFAKGGFRIVSIDSSEKRDDDSFLIEGSDRRGEQWEIEITK